MNQQTVTEAWTSSLGIYRIGSKEDLDRILEDISIQIGIHFPWSGRMNKLLDTTILADEFDVVYQHAWQINVCKFKANHWFIKEIPGSLGFFFIPCALLFPVNEEIDITINL